MMPAPSNPMPSTADQAEAEDKDAISLYARREKIFVHYVGGKFQKLRLYTGWPLLLAFFLTPWLQWGERQAVLFDLPGRQFYLFGITFWPQDFMLLAWTLIIAAFSLFAVTSMVGRLWCGYTCPQTVWTSVFLWAEKITEGKRNQRMRLDKQGWSFTKIRKKFAKHFLWFGFAALTGITFVGYFTPIRQLVLNLFVFDINFWAIAWVVFFTLATYINAGWLREQVCIYMCPYARFQSAMIDKDTMVVAYDGGRGEPRGSRKRGPRPAELGDCINCKLCVQVCPTGIDIRDGLQYECIQCAHCVDACDQVMGKMGYEKGLVRYATERSLSEGGDAHSHFLRLRTIGYFVAIGLMIALFSYTLFTRIPFSIDILRERGQLFYLEQDQIRNNYSFKVVNKSQSDNTFELTISGAEPLPWIVSERFFDIPAGEVLEMPVSMAIKQSDLATSMATVTIHMCETNGDRCVEEITRFMGPMEPGSAGSRP